MTQLSAGQRFRQALAEEQPLQVIGAINANHALLAKRAGFRAIYLVRMVAWRPVLSACRIWASTPWMTCLQTITDCP